MHNFNGRRSALQQCFTTIKFLSSYRDIFRTLEYYLVKIVIFLILTRKPLALTSRKVAALTFT